jgi:hypothetical protein
MVVVSCGDIELTVKLQMRSVIYSTLGPINVDYYRYCGAPQVKLVTRFGHRGFNFFNETFLKYNDE